jgi:hypothetical protein
MAWTVLHPIPAIAGVAGLIPLSWTMPFQVTFRYKRPSAAISGPALIR